jgi:hypothetical protein
MKRLALILVFSWGSGAFAAPLPSPFPFQRDAVVDPGRSIAYVAKPNGTIDAIDLINGRALWTSSEAALPLGLDTNLLIAQVDSDSAPANELHVAVLDAVSGKKLTTAAIPLPIAVHALVDDRPNEWFQAVAEREGVLFLISWDFRQELQGGDADDSERSPLRIYAGSARISPLTGQVVTSDGGPASDRPRRVKQRGLPPFVPWQAAGVSARTEGGSAGPLTLKRADVASGRSLPDILLSEHGLVGLPSADQRHVLVGERVQGAPRDQKYRWLIFAMDTGVLAAEERFEVSCAPFFLFGDNIVFQSQPGWHLVNGVRVDDPLQMNALRLSSGIPIWKVELRDLAYRGPGIAASHKRSRR